MRNLKTIALLLLPLLGCFAQLEDQSVTIKHSLCGASGPDCVPGSGASLTIVQVSGSNTFTVNFGDQPLFKPSTALGPATLNTSLLINQAAFDMTTTGSGADFSGVNTAQVLAAPRQSTGPGDDPCATPANCPVLAAYNKATDGAATRHLALKGNGSDIVKLIDQTTHQIIIEITASGTAPTPALWNADVSMDMGLNSRANFP
jgi:hypothetical protein